jgi:hypothetical protein
MTGPERPAAEYLCYEVVRAVRDRMSEDLPKTEFNKQCYIVYKELQEEGIDVELPVYWYEHGIMVDLDPLTAHFLTFPRKDWETHSGSNATIRDKWVPDEFGVDESIAEAIQEKATEVARRFAGSQSTRVVKDETYEKYGNEFVQSLNDLRYYLEDLGDYDTVSKESYVADVGVNFSDFSDNTFDRPQATSGTDPSEIEDSITEHLDRMVATYPSDLYDKMEPQFREWEQITRQLAYNHMFSQLSNFTDEFWLNFSKGELRINHNENVPQTKIARWVGERSEKIDELETEIEKYRTVMLDNREETDELASVAESYSEAVRKTASELESDAK